MRALHDKAAAAFIKRLRTKDDRKDDANDGGDDDDA
jgi:hypothetical protein